MCNSIYYKLDMCNASRQITRQLKEIAELYFGILPLLPVAKMYRYVYMVLGVVKREAHT